MNKEKATRFIEFMALPKDVFIKILKFIPIPINYKPQKK